MFFLLFWMPELQLLTEAEEKMAFSAKGLTWQENVLAAHLETEPEENYVSRIETLQNGEELRRKQREIEDIVGGYFEEFYWLREDAFQVKSADRRLVRKSFTDLNEKMAAFGVNALIGGGPSRFIAFLGMQERKILEAHEVLQCLSAYPVSVAFEYLYWVNQDCEKKLGAYLRKEKQYEILEQIGEYLRSCQEKRLDTLEDIFRLGRRGAREYLGEMGELSYDLLTGRID